MANTRQTHAQAELRTDIPRGSWVDRWLPAPARPYARLMRLDRPIGTWLLLFPCWWGLVLATPVIHIEQIIHPIWGLMYLAPGFKAAALFTVGALVMRGAGCTYNDIVDRDIDAKVARTALRPIPSGQVSVRAALIFLAAQLLVGLVILLQFNGFTVWLGIASLVLVFTYPLMKRITYWPQLFLGLTFNWGVLMGWGSQFGWRSMSGLIPTIWPDNGFVWSPVLLYVGAIAWTLHYDTIYAHQDKEDDALIGVKSTALRLGAATKLWLCVFSAMAIALFAASLTFPLGYRMGHFGLAAVALHLAWQIKSVNLNDPADCLAKFQSNRWIGWILLATILAGKIVTFSH